MRQVHGGSRASGDTYLMPLDGGVALEGSLCSDRVSDLRLKEARLAALPS